MLRGDEAELDLEHVQNLGDLEIGNGGFRFDSFHARHEVAEAINVLQVEEHFRQFCESCSLMPRGSGPVAVGYQPDKTCPCDWMESRPHPVGTKEVLDNSNQYKQRPLLRQCANFR